MLIQIPQELKVLIAFIINSTTARSKICHDDGIDVHCSSPMTMSLIRKHHLLTSLELKLFYIIVSCLFCGFNGGFIKCVIMWQHQEANLAWHPMWERWWLMTRLMWREKNNENIIMWSDNEIRGWHVAMTGGLALTIWVRDVGWVGEGVRWQTSGPPGWHDAEVIRYAPAATICEFVFKPTFSLLLISIYHLSFNPVFLVLVKV